MILPPGRHASESADDWRAFIGHLEATLDHFEVPEPEREQVLTFIESTREDIVEAD